MLILGLHHVRRAVGDGPLVNIEIGCSIGLTVLWPKFHYEYGPGPSLGDADSCVQIVAEMIGEPLPVDFTQFPQVDQNIGVEYEPIDADAPDAIDWLEALIWPNHQGNLLFSRAALKLLRFEPPTIHNGEAAIVIPRVVATLTAESVICVCHSHTWNQMDYATRNQIDEHLKRESMGRSVVRLSFESTTEHSLLPLIHYKNGNKLEPIPSAECETHGRRTNYLGENGA